MIKGIDHLVYTSTTLEKGMDEIEALLGIRPVLAGQHPQFGTHNALLSIGEGIFFEVIAPDPSLDNAALKPVFFQDVNAPSKLATWVLKTDKIAQMVENSEKEGLTLGPVQIGNRKRPDGSLLTWKLSNPYQDRLNGIIPFLIDWGNVVHPSTVFPKAGVLVDFWIEHPNPNLIASNLAVLESDIEVKEAKKISLVAIIETKQGKVELR